MRLSYTHNVFPPRSPPNQVTKTRLENYNFEEHTVIIEIQYSYDSFAKPSYDFTSTPF